MLTEETRRTVDVLLILIQVHQANIIWIVHYQMIYSVRYNAIVLYIALIKTAKRKTPNCPLFCVPCDNHPKVIASTYVHAISHKS